ncbi:MAG: GTPase HflX [Verrucomicrobia bacterium]|nr:GTPase HflX [Verrucomicrobiota bacterium]
MTEDVSLEYEPLRFVWQDASRQQDIRAVVVGITKSAAEKEVVQEHLQELKLLADTQGIPVVGEQLLAVRGIRAATFLTEGKLAELENYIKLHNINLVIFDDEISPAQQRNLERQFNMPVIDRTEVILGVFAMRAKSKEAKLQIELAEVRYLIPRLKRMWTHLSRQSGGGGGAAGGGYQKGEGEKQLEIDKRILRRRMERLQREILEIKEYRQTQRSLRERTKIPVIAIVGYTNAGKSTLMNALTEADVYIEDKLFATLDTTTRKYVLPNNQEVLFIDTVGFIRKLPHLLVAAFRSTLEEAVHADLILHVLDATHPMVFEQAETTLKVLEELESHDTPMIVVLNKIDRVETPSQKALFLKLKLKYSGSQCISALSKEGLDSLQAEIIKRLSDRRTMLQLRIPQKDYHILASAIATGKIYKQEYEENDVLVDLEVPTSTSFRFMKYVRE